MEYMLHHLSTAYFHHDKIFILVTKWGECVKIDRGYDEKDSTSVVKVNQIGICDDFSLIPRNIEPILLHITCTF